MHPMFKKILETPLMTFLHLFSTSHGTWTNRIRVSFLEPCSAPLLFETVLGGGPVMCSYSIAVT